MFKWTPKKGEPIPFNELEDDHLSSVIKWIEKRAEDGFIGYDLFEEEDVLNRFHYYALRLEQMERRMKKLEQKMFDNGLF